MQLTLVSAAAALLATASAAKTAAELNKECNTSAPIAKVVNRCSYPIYLWSIDGAEDETDDQYLELATGDVYKENLRDSTVNPDATGISIKMTKKPTLKWNKEITQLEYHLTYNPGYEGDYLDMSFVDCTSDAKDCPGYHDGYWMKAGDQKSPGQIQGNNNEHCPIFSVTGASEAAAVAYMLWDDVQTKFCSNDASIDLYLCGGEAPGDVTEEPASSAAPSSVAPSSLAAPSTYETPSSSEQPSTTAAPAYTPEVEAVSAAEITPAPQAPKVVKTQVVYETVYVKEKRHAHGHRHQHFRA